MLTYIYTVQTPKGFFIAAAFVALVMGGSQALSRSLFSQMIPRSREAEYFGLYEISDKGTSWLAPLFFGLALQFTKSYRLAILSLTGVLQALGASNLWQAIDRVADADLGGSTGLARHRSLAVSGAVVLCWLADRTQTLASTTALISPEAVHQQPSSAATTSPNDRDLIDASRRWLTSIVLT